MIDFSHNREWMDRLRVDGESALRDFLEGRIFIPALSATRPESVVYQIYHLDGFDSDVARGLDLGCKAICAEFRSNLLQENEATRGTGVRRLATLMAIIRRIRPEETVTDFHRRFDHWNQFFENFVFDRRRDLRFEFFHILALSQDIAEKQGADVSRMPEFWLSVCAESGGEGRYSDRYIWVGMLGIRHLPLGDNSDAIIDFSLRGLARWAVARKPNAMKFKSHWNLLQEYYPRDREFWTYRIRRVVSDEENNIGGEAWDGSYSPISEWWLDEVGITASENDISAPDEIQNSDADPVDKFTDFIPQITQSQESPNYSLQLLNSVLNQDSNENFYSIIADVDQESETALFDWMNSNTLTEIDAAIVKGMISRGDRGQDIAFWFGVNSGRIIDIKNGVKFPTVIQAKPEFLPPPGPYPPIRKMVQVMSETHEIMISLDARNFQTKREQVMNGFKFFLKMFFSHYFRSPSVEFKPLRPDGSGGVSENRRGAKRRIDGSSQM